MKLHNYPKVSMYWFYLCACGRKQQEHLGTRQSLVESSLCLILLSVTQNPSPCIHIGLLYTSQTQDTNKIVFRLSLEGVTQIWNITLLSYLTLILKSLIKYWLLFGCLLNDGSPSSRKIAERDWHMVITWLQKSTQMCKLFFNYIFKLPHFHWIDGWLWEMSVTEGNLCPFPGRNFIFLISHNLN